MLNQVAHALAEDNLRLGRTVIADCVNPLLVTRDGWLNVARTAGVPAVEVEVTCSDRNEHSRRLPRAASDGDVQLTRWQEVTRHYRVWEREHLVIDTAHQAVEDSVAWLRRLIAAAHT